jgi:ABC-type lipoprotein release transport system permease subunit
MAVPLSYNVRNVLQRPLPTLATAVGVALTVAILIGALALASGFQEALRASGRPDNVIFLRKGADSEISSAITREQAALLGAMPQVATDAQGRAMASPELVVLAYLDRREGAGASNVTIRGLDAGGMALRDSVKVEEGRLFTAGVDEIVVGRRVHERFAGMDVGKTLKLGTRDFTIAGVFDAGGASYETEIWGDNKVLMPLFRGEVFQSVTVRMKDASQFEAWKTEVEKDPRLGLQSKIERDWYETQSEAFAGILRSAGTFITLIMAIGAIFGAMNTMYAAVGSRSREVATLLILGFSPVAILVSFVVESVFLSLLGGVLGCLVSLPINGITTSTMNFASFSEIGFAFRVTPGAMLAGMIWAAAMGVVGGFLPALKAARQPLAASLREM